MGGGGGGTTINTPAQPTQAELDLQDLNKQLAQKQLDNINQIQPYQQQLLQLSTEQLNQNKAYTDALNGAITPQQQADAAKADFERSQRLGPIQDQLLQMQLDQLKSGGAATPEQLARIKTATESGIEAGSADIDSQTQRGIGLIKDELANSRGLRLSDSPIGSEAALLTREGAIQKGSLTKNLQAAGASAALNYPLAVQSVTSGINQNQQNIVSAAQNFQNQLRQQAYQNRLALTGPATSGGIGLAGIGNNMGVRSTNPSVSSVANQASGASQLGSIGSLASGVGGLFSSGIFSGAAEAAPLLLALA